MLYVGLDLSRKRLDFDALLPDGERFERGAVPPDADGLLSLVRRLGDANEPVLATIESMSGARFVHDQLELAGWDVRIADAYKAKGLAPLACKTDKIDSWVLAELGRLRLVPEIWLADPAVRAERERARFRLHLVRHRTALKNRVHATLIAHGVPNPSSDLFGERGRELLARLSLPEPWQQTTEASLELIDYLDAQISAIERELRAAGADHRYVPLLLTCPTRASAPRSTSPASATGAAHSGRTGPATCAGRWSKRRTPPCATPATSRSSPASSLATAADAAARSPCSMSPANSPRRSGTCSTATNPLPRQAPSKF
jgi:Transposase